MKRNLFLSVLAVFALLLNAGTALAVGTGAGTTISNLATVYYNVAGIPQTEVESGGGTPTTFDVDTKIDLLVDTTDAAAVQIAPGGTAATTFRVYNMGNDTQDILLTDVPTGPANPFGGLLTDTFDSSAAVVLYEEDGTTAGFQSDEDNIVASLNDVIPSTDGTDNFRTVYLVITADGALTQDDLAVYALRGTVRATDGSALTNDASPDIATGSEIVFADPAGTDDVIYDAQHSDRSAFVVTAAALTITKSAAVYDTAAGLPTDTYAIPGAIITYTINVANAAGGSTAQAITIVDEIPDSTDFYLAPAPAGGTVEYDATRPFDPNNTNWSYTPVDSGDGTDPSVGAIKIRMPDINAGVNADATFNVKIR